MTSPDSFRQRSPESSPADRLSNANRTSVLVVDDEPQILRALKSILGARNYSVTEARTGSDALLLAATSPPELVILDLSLPDMTGFEVCKELRTWYEAPILVLSVQQGVEDKIEALNLGADDYLTKPFAAGELLARVGALLRRAAFGGSDPVWRVGALEIDAGRRRVSRGGEEIRLTRSEFDILAALARRKGCVLTSSALLQEVRGPSYGDDTQTLRVHIGNLRRKIEVHPSVPRYIITEPGVGYRLSDS